MQTKCRSMSLRRQRVALRRLLLMVWVIVLSLAAPMLATAQTVPPPRPGQPVIVPPPGTPVVQPNFPTTPPPGIPPVTGAGVLAVIPPATGGAVALINITPGDGSQMTLIVPANAAYSIIVRIQPMDASEIPAVPLPAAITGAAFFFRIDIYRGDTSQMIHNHPTPLVLGIFPPAGINPAAMALFRFDEAAAQYQPQTISFDLSTGTLQISLPNTSIFVLGATTTIPGGLPSTGEPTSTRSPLPWAIFVTVVAAVTAATFYRRRAK